MKRFSLVAVAVLPLIVCFAWDSAVASECGPLTPIDPSHASIAAMPDSLWDNHPVWTGQPPAVRTLLARVSKRQRNLRASIPSQARNFSTSLPASLSPVRSLGNKQFDSTGATELERLVVDLRAHLNTLQPSGATLSAGSLARPYSEQLENWPKNLLRYYGEIESKLSKYRLANGSFTERAVCELRQYAAQRYAFPGYSNHQSGLAVDFLTKSSHSGPQLIATTSSTLVVGTGKTNIQLWCESPAFAWLRLNARRYGFVQALIDEPWHWEYRPQLAADPVRANRMAPSCG